MILIARAGHAVQHDLVRTIMREIGGDAEGCTIKSRPRIVECQRALSGGSPACCIRRSKRDVDDAAVRREVEAKRLALILCPVRAPVRTRLTKILRIGSGIKERIGIPLRIPRRPIREFETHAAALMQSLTV